VLGGIDNPWGAAHGGFMVGVMENITGAYLVGPEIKLSVAFAASRQAYWGACS
jgi:branched-chain amino acid transport system permease protein